VEEEEPAPKPRKTSSFWTPERRAEQREKFKAVRAKREANVARRRAEAETGEETP